MTFVGSIRQLGQLKVVDVLLLVSLICSEKLVRKEGVIAARLDYPWATKMLLINRGFEI